MPISCLELVSLQQMVKIWVKFSVTHIIVYLRDIVFCDNCNVKLIQSMYFVAEMHRVAAAALQECAEKLDLFAFLLY